MIKPKKNNQKKRITEGNRTDENVIFIRKKPPMNYVNAVMKQFNSNCTDSVLLITRGMSIYTAVDIAEIVRNRFMKT